MSPGEEDKNVVMEDVKANISFRGANIWILACAILIASIGLNVNSTAVIIGAMLISPLMGPIVGAGFALGIFDFTLLRRSLKNLFNATSVSLVVATVYFYISPFKETQSELLARTSPNIYDVMIAFFGGIAGAVAITRAEKGNPIPGVAIATALMPPLCTAGYGLAIGNFKYFFGALFLYSINCVFICIGTLAIIKYLAYPPIKQVDAKHEKQVRYIITTLTLALIVPSVYLAYDLMENRRYNQQLNEFISKEFLSKDLILIYKNVNESSNPRTCELAFLDSNFSKSDIDDLNRRLAVYDIRNTELVIKQDTLDFKSLIREENSKNQLYLNEKDLQIANLEKKINANKYDAASVLKEAQALFPEVGFTEMAIANHYYNEDTDSVRVVPVVLYNSTGGLSAKDEQKMTVWLSQKMGKGEVLMYRQNAEKQEEQEKKNKKK